MLKVIVLLVMFMLVVKVGLVINRVVVRVVGCSSFMWILGYVVGWVMLGCGIGEE